MKPLTRNLVVWTGVLGIVAAIWFFATRSRLQFIDPSLFLIVLAAAAAALTALLWWEIATDTSDAGDAGREDRQSPATGEKL